MHQPLVPGVFDIKTNTRIHYCHILSGYISFVLLLVITISTLMYVSKINDIVGDMNELIPDARKGIALLRTVCNNRNFTYNYPNVKEVCESF